MKTNKTTYTQEERKNKLNSIVKIVLGDNPPLSIDCLAKQVGVKQSILKSWLQKLKKSKTTGNFDAKYTCILKWKEKILMLRYAPPITQEKTIEQTIKQTEVIVDIMYQQATDHKFILKTSNELDINSLNEALNELSDQLRDNKNEVLSHSEKKCSEQIKLIFALTQFIQTLLLQCSLEQVTTCLPDINKSVNTPLNDLIETQLKMHQPHVKNNDFFKLDSTSNHASSSNQLPSKRV